MQVRVSEQRLARLDQKRGDLSRSEAIRRALDDWPGAGKVWSYRIDPGAEPQIVNAPGFEVLPARKTRRPVASGATPRFDAGLKPIPPYYDAADVVESVHPLTVHPLTGDASRLPRITHRHKPARADAAGRSVCACGAVKRPTGEWETFDA